MDRWAGDEDGAEAVLVARRQESDAGRRGNGDLGLVVGGGAELHRRRHVDDEPGGQVPVGDLLANVCLAGARRDVPVDAAHVVARLVQP